MILTSIVKESFTSHYCSFKGRMSRRYFGSLIAVLLPLNLAVYSLIYLLSVPDYIFIIFFSFEFLPLFGAITRRLHDRDVSGKPLWNFLSFVIISLGFLLQYRIDPEVYWLYCFYATAVLSFIYFVVVAVICSLKGLETKNRYGQAPLN